MQNPSGIYTHKIKDEALECLEWIIENKDKFDFDKFETKFINNLVSRYNEHGKAMVMSYKQLAVLRKLYEQSKSILDRVPKKKLDNLGSKKWEN